MGHRKQGVFRDVLILEMQGNVAYQERDYCIDVLKALSIVFVLIWHFHPIQIQAGAAFGLSGLFARGVTFFYLYVTLLAVPTLISASLYLFFTKAGSGWEYARSRIVRLMKLYLFWFCVQNAVYVAAVGQLPEFSFEELLWGGPDLPYVRGSVFYFLSLLALLSLLSALFLRMGEGLKALFSVSVALATCLYFTHSSWTGYLITYKDVFSYIVYIPVAYYLYRHKERFIENRFLFLGAFIASILFEKLILTANPSYYGRLSIITGVLVLLSFVFSCPVRRNYAVVEGLSKDCLGFFSVHKYAQLAAILLIGNFERMIGFPPLTFSLGKIQIALTATFLTLLIVCLLKKTPLRDFVAERTSVSYGMDGLKRETVVSTCPGSPR
jgi:hypothetical protein